MNEIIIYRIIIGVVIVGILWLYFKKNKVNQVDDRAILEKDKEIEGLKKEKEGLQNLKNETKESPRSFMPLTKSPSVTPVAQNITSSLIISLILYFLLKLLIPNFLALFFSSLF